MDRKSHRISKASLTNPIRKFNRNFCISPRKSRTKQALRQQRKNTTRMSWLISQILHGRLLNYLIMLFSRESFNSTNSETKINTRSKTTASNINTDDSVVQSTSDSPIPPLPSEVDFRSTAIRQRQRQQSQISEDKKSFGNEYAKIVSLDTNAPPLTARYMKMFTYQGDYDELSTGLAMTNMFVWQFNRVYQCEDQISKILQKIELVQHSKAELESLVVDLNGLLEDPLDDEERESLAQDHREASERIQKYQMEIETLDGKLQYWIEKKKWPHDQIFTQMKEVLQRNNLLDEKVEPSEHEKEEHMMDDVEMETASQTPSELAEQELHREREAALDLVREARFRLQDAEQKLDNWKEYYDREYSKFRNLSSQSPDYTTKTEFDGFMLLEAQEATRELIQAEEKLQETENHARKVGATFNEFDQDSGFLDHVDDGYRDSWEAHETAHVDREWIESWMQEEKPEYPAICDEWNFKEVDLCDSVSLVAEGKERNRINRWREMCELTEVENEASNTEQT